MSGVKVLLILLAVLLVIDWAQTLRIAREPERFYEKWNVVLPQHPSAAVVNLYFACVSCASAAIAWSLWPYPVLVSSLGFVFAVVEAACVVNNIRNGVKP